MAKKILFLLGSANLSGGTYVILQHALHLQKLGHQVTIALVFMTQQEFLTLKHSDKCWHPGIKELQFINIEEAKNHPVDIAIFTWWATLFSFEKISSKSFVYFVQSIESRFYQKEYTFLRQLVNKTYQLGIPVITEATWIQKYLQDNYNSRCELVKNGILKSLYTTQGNTFAEKSKDKLRILVEGPVDILFKNVMKTIELCKQANVGEIWLLTSSPIANIPGVARTFSQVPISEVPAIYRSCDVLVKLSYVEGMFGPPLEMFHCGGTAIVYDVTGHDEYIIHDVNALVAKTDDENSVIEYLKLLQSDRRLLSRLSAGAKQTADQWIDWQQSSNEFTISLEKLTTPTLSDEEIKSISKQVNKSLNEHVDTIILKGTTRIDKEYATASLYESGAYALMIPITQGDTQIGIVFGKSYRSLILYKIELIGEGNSLPEGSINLQLDKMINITDALFECQSEASMLIVNTQVKDKNLMPDATFCLRVEFKPITIRENKSVKNTFMTEIS